MAGCAGAATMLGPWWAKAGPFPGDGAPLYSPKGAEFVARGEAVAAGGPFTPDWPSLSTYKIPDWYADAKFGIFIHWGVYSVPAYMSEWYPRMMYQRSNPAYWHHLTKHGRHTKFGYKDFIPHFRAEKFNADDWADLFVKSGAKYVVPVAEHHDGFGMYDSALSDWTAAKIGPRRDIIGELAKSIRERGLVFGLSSHRAEHWWFFNGGRKFPSDVQDPRWESLYGPAQPEVDPDEAFMRDWFARTVELIEKYDPQVLWFDWWIERPAFEPWRQKLAAFLYNRAAQRGTVPVLNYKNKAYPETAAVLDLERSGLSEIRTPLWQTDTSTSFISWGYIENNMFKTPDRIVSDLVDTISKNGVLLLNLGPRPDGLIPDEEKNIMLAVGKWLEVNGPAVYGSRPWKIFGEGQNTYKEHKNFGVGELSTPKLTAEDIRFTTRDGKLFVFVMDWPKDGKVEVATLGKAAGMAAGPVKNVRLLGSDGKVEWTQTDAGLLITLPATRPCDFAACLEVEGVL